MNSSTQLQAACDAILTDTQVGEIYVISKDTNCKTCLRMAIYAANAGSKAGRVAGSTSNWVCTKIAVTPPMRNCTKNATTWWTTGTTQASSGVAPLAAKATFVLFALAAAFM